jgi:hypothetical protein
MTTKNHDLAMGAARELGCNNPLLNSIQRQQLADNIDQWVGRWVHVADRDRPRMSWPREIAVAAGMPDRCITACTCARCV